jgi:uncharacterized protein (DUF433 family)
MRYNSGKKTTLVDRAFMAPAKTYIQTEENGVYRVSATRVMPDSVVAAFHAGHSAETIRRQYPALTLEEVYGAIAYYLNDRRRSGPRSERAASGSQIL